MAIVWYQCYIDNGKTSFGFSVCNDIITGRFPVYNFVGMSVKNQIVRNWFLKEKAQVVKIAVQNDTIS